MLVHMSSRKLFAITINAVAFAVLATSAYSQTRPKPPQSVRLYVFDNGIIKDTDVTRYHFKKEEIAEPDFVVCSYLIVHPKGTLNPLAAPASFVVACSQAAAQVRHCSRTMELSANAAVVGIHEA